MKPVGLMNPLKSQVHRVARARISKLRPREGGWEKKNVRESLGRKIGEWNKSLYPDQRFQVKDK